MSETKSTPSLESTLKSLDTEEFIDIHFYRPIGYQWALFFNKLGVSPNSITIASIFIGIAAGICFYFQSLAINVIGMLLLIWANSYDSADGQLARMTGQKSALGRDEMLTTKLGVPFRTLAQGSNIAFTSLWDNYPDSLSIPLSGRASHAYLMMAGSTNHMQCRIANGIVRVYYTDGTSDVLELVNPDNWCPIEQDFYVDGQAFTVVSPRPYRIHFKTGLVSNDLGKDLGIKGVYGRSIEGGAGVLLDMLLNPSKELSHLTLETLSNDVVIGLMGVTLQ